MEEAKAEIQGQRAKMYRYSIRSNGVGMSNCHNRIVEIIKRALDSEPNLIEAHLKHINYLQSKYCNKNVEALLKAKYCQCLASYCLKRQLIEESIVLNLKAKLEALGPLGWLQLKPGAYKEEIMASFQHLQAIIYGESSVVEVIPIKEFNVFKSDLYVQICNAAELLLIEARSKKEAPFYERCNRKIGYMWQFAKK